MAVRTDEAARVVQVPGYTVKRPECGSRQTRRGIGATEREFACPHLVDQRVISPPNRSVID